MKEPRLCIECKYVKTKNVDFSCSDCLAGNFRPLWEPRDDKPTEHLNVYQARKLGRDYCQTEGNEHYKEGGIEPIDLMVAKGIFEDYALGNIVKYATRFKKTQNLDDLRKAQDYAHILCGVKLNEKTM